MEIADIILRWMAKKNYDIASLSACDQYGNCMFFKQKVMTCNNCIHSEVCYLRKDGISETYADKCGYRLFDDALRQTMVVKISKDKTDDLIKQLNSLNHGILYSSGTEEIIPLVTVFSYFKDEMYSGGGYTECDNCKQRFSNTGFPMIHDAKYCPECGARILIKIRSIVSRLGYSNSSMPWFHMAYFRA